MKRSICRTLLMVVWFWWGALAAQAAVPAGVVGMVLDVQGKAELMQKDTASKLQLLSYIKPDTQLRLEVGARVSVSHYGAGLIYQLSGPLLAEVGSGQIKVLNGAAPVTKSLGEKVVAAAINPNLGAAAFKMRAIGAEIALLAPSQRTVVLGTRPAFQWLSDEPASCQLSVIELPQRVVAQATVDGSAWQLPAQTSLEPGKEYRWTVSYTAADGQLRSAVADFSVASQADADATLALRPAAGAGVDEWVLYATLLRERRMLDEARQVWREIAGQRPDLATAQSMAR